MDIEHGSETLSSTGIGMDAVNPIGTSVCCVQDSVGQPVERATRALSSDADCNITSHHNRTTSATNTGRSVVSLVAKYGAVMANETVAHWLRQVTMVVLDAYNSVEDDGLEDVVNYVRDHTHWPASAHYGRLSSLGPALLVSHTAVHDEQTWSQSTTDSRVDIGAPPKKTQTQEKKHQQHRSHHLVHSNRFYTDDPQLKHEGILQAQELARTMVRLFGFPAALFTSPMRRTVQTAEIMRKTVQQMLQEVLHCASFVLRDMIEAIGECRTDHGCCTMDVLDEWETKANGWLQWISSLTMTHAVKSMTVSVMPQLSKYWSTKAQESSGVDLHPDTLAHLPIVKEDRPHLAARLLDLIYSTSTGCSSPYDHAPLKPTVTDASSAGSTPYLQNTRCTTVDHKSVHTTCVRVDQRDVELTTAFDDPNLHQLLGRQSRIRTCVREHAYMLGGGSGKYQGATPVPTQLGSDMAVWDESYYNLWGASSVWFVTHPIIIQHLACMMHGGAEQLLPAAMRTAVELYPNEIPSWIHPATGMNSWNQFRIRQSTTPHEQRLAKKTSVTKKWSTRQRSQRHEVTSCEFPNTRASKNTTTNNSGRERSVTDNLYRGDNPTILYRPIETPDGVNRSKKVASSSSSSHSRRSGKAEKRSLALPPSSAISTPSSSRSPLVKKQPDDIWDRVTSIGSGLWNSLPSIQAVLTPSPSTGTP